MTSAWPFYHRRVCTATPMQFQATATGFGLVNAENVYKVCDQPHPLKAIKFIEYCALKKNLDQAWLILKGKQVTRQCHRQQPPSPKKYSCD